MQPPLEIKRAQLCRVIVPTTAPFPAPPPPPTYTRSLSAPQTLEVNFFFVKTRLTVALELSVLGNCLSAYEKYEGHLKPLTCPLS